MQITVTDVTAVVALVGGIAGTVLGILSFVSDWRRDSVRLLADVYWGYEKFEPQGTPTLIAFHVVNLSNFPVTIVQAGFEIERSQDVCVFHYNDDRGQLQFPVEIPSRRSHSFYWPLSALDRSDIHLGTKFFIGTDCAKRIRFARRKPKAMKAEFDAGARYESVKVFLRPKIRQSR